MAASIEDLEEKEKWNRLPDIALVYIYRHVSDIDRLNMACSCKNWYRLFGAPILWRKRRVMFNSLSAERTCEKERKFIIKYGQHLRKLCLGFGTPTFRSCMLISKAADSYTKCICSRNDINLLEVDLERMHLEQHWHFILSRNRLITAICRLLRKQKFLNTVYLSGGRARVHDGCRVLEALGKGLTGRSINSLYMEDFFETNVFPCRQQRYVNALSKFLALAHLHINYKYLNNVVLKNIANKLSRSLKTLSLILEGDLRGVEIPSDCWFEFTEVCPNTKVNIYLCTTIIRGNDLRTPFVPGLPLYDCYLTSWLRIDETEQRLAVLIQHLGNLYNKTLENFAMFFDYHERLDSELLYMLGRCQYISDLCLQCRISADTVIEIMKLHHEKKITLSSLNLTIPGLSDSDWERINAEKERLISDVSEFAHIGPNEFGSSIGSSTITADEIDDDGGDADDEEDRFNNIFFLARQEADIVISDDENDEFEPPENGDNQDDGPERFLM